MAVLSPSYCDSIIIMNLLLCNFSGRFLEALTDKRREQAENLAEMALKEAKAKQEEERMNTALAEAKKAAATKSVPSTPAVTPSVPQKGLLEGEEDNFLTICD